MPQRIALPWGCEMTPINVWPSNWQSARAQMKKPWYITYRFFDPTLKNMYPAGFQVSVRGMNDEKDRSRRAEATQAIINDEMNRLVYQGYNPITKKSVPPVQSGSEISPTDTLAEALKQAIILWKALPKTKKDCGHMIPWVEKAATQLGLQYIPVIEIRRKHMVRILEKVGQLKPKWSAFMHNKAVKYFRPLFKIMLQLEVIEISPMEGIDKLPEMKRVRETLSLEERKQIREHLVSKNPAFLRFIHIFFHSGGRITELLELKKEDVNLEQQRYKTIIRKGKLQRELWRPIKNISVPYWTEIMNMAENNQVLFSDGLVPGERRISPRQISRRWKTHVKDYLGIKADFYALKHSNLTEVSAELGVRAAADLAGHTSPDMVAKVYDINYIQRTDDAIKLVGNEF